MEDALYLLLHDELIAIIESAVLVKASGMDTNQLLEVEMALEQRAQQISSPTVVVSRVRSTVAMVRKSVCTRIVENVWLHGCAFRVDLANRVESVDVRITSPNRERPVLSPIKSPMARIHSVDGLPSRSQSPIVRKKASAVEAIFSCATNQEDFTRLSSNLKSSHHALAVHTRDVLTSSRWIQEHCVQEMTTRDSSLFLKLRKEKAAQILMNTLVARAKRMVDARFQAWRIHTLSGRCQHLVTQYCKLKGAAKILGLARRLQKRSFLWRWHRWMRRIKMEHKMERLAGAATIQSWARCVFARSRRKTFHLERAATTLQSAWRGYFTRKMLRRRRRYEIYSVAASVVQRSYRAYHNRCQFAIHWARHKASWCITRSLRRYCARRRMFKSWCDRVARFHSAAVIQVWIRQTLQRKRDERTLRELQTSSAFTLQRFFRYAHFLICFGSRVQRLTKRKNAAAVLLQNAYRAKLARARFYALKDQLEAQRRQEILQMMWDNAYATTIQRSWRKRRQWRLLNQQCVHQSPRSVVDDPPLQLASDQEHCE